MKKTLWKLGKSAACFGIVLLLLQLTALPGLANSAQMYWEGTTATGAIITNEDCPIVVEHENLTFDVAAFPEQYYYNDVNAFLAYEGKVTAEYTFYNPSAYTVDAVLVFPFGTVPDYGIIRDSETDELIWTSDTDKYDITIDGTPIEKQLRHTFSHYGAQFSLEEDLPRLHDSFMEDDFYRPDLPVTQYSFAAKNVDTETYDAATAAFLFSGDRNKTRLFMENQSGGSNTGEGQQLSTWIQEEPFVLNVIGEPLSQPPEWKFYETGACEKEIEGTMELVDTKEITFRDLVLSEYPEDSAVLEHDWYNAIVESMKRYEWDGVISGAEVRFDISDQLMRWYEYTITVEPGEKIVNQVTAPVYPSIDNSYEVTDSTYDPAKYTYTYLLSPAQTWKEFGSLDIVINTPFTLTESTPGGFEETDTGYTASFSSLPKEELTFTLQEKPQEEETEAEESSSPSWSFGFPFALFPIWLIAFVVVLIVVIVVILAVAITKKHRD